MIQIAIVDDEVMFLDCFINLVKEKFENNGIECEISAYTSGLHFQKICLEKEFDVLFLDIDLPDISGIQLASDLRKKNMELTLIFVSAHNHFVFESIQYRPFRFIRKSELRIDVDEAIHAYCNQLKKANTILTLKLEGNQNQAVDLAKIMYFYSLRHEIFYLLDSGDSVRLSFRVYTMELLEEKLKKFGFIRTHKTYLVNCNYIYKIQTAKIILRDNTQVNISRGRTEKVKKLYQLFLRGEEQL